MARRNNDQVYCLRIAPVKGREIRIMQFVIFFLCSLPPLYSQGDMEFREPDMVFEEFEVPGGKLANHVISIVQDSFGFMWFGSSKGLHRYDGYQFKSYLNDPEDKNSIGFNYVENILVAKDGSLWLCNFGNKIDHYNLKTKTFTHYVLKSRDSVDDERILATEMVEDDEGNIWIATHYGVFRLNVESGGLKHFLNEPENPYSLSYDICRSIYKDRQGTIWIGSGLFWIRSQEGGLNRYIPETEDFERYVHDPDNSNTLSSNKVTEIYEDTKGNFWIGTCGDGLHQMDREQGTFTRLPNTDANPLQLAAPYRNDDIWLDHIRSIYEDHSQRLWIASYGWGLKYYDPFAQVTKAFVHDDTNSKSIHEDFVWSLFQSCDGTIWGSTTGSNGGVFRIKQELSDYQILHNTLDTTTSFCTAKNGSLWVGTSHNGIYSFDTMSGHKKYLDFTSLKIVLPESFQNKEATKKDITKNILNNIREIIEDHSGNLWMMPAEDDAILKFNPITKLLQYYIINSADTNKLIGEYINDIYIDEDDNIWSINARNDLFLYDKGGDKFIAVLTSPLNIDTDTLRYCSKVAPSRDGKLWIASIGMDSKFENFHLTKYDDQIKSSTKVVLNKPPHESLFFKQKILDIVEDEQGVVWICGEKQLVRIHPKSGDIESINANNFGSESLRGMMKDGPNQLLVFGDKITLLDTKIGMACIATLDIEYYPPTYCSQVVSKNINGVIYTSVQNGFLLLNPNTSNKVNLSHKPNLLITDFMLLEESKKDTNSMAYDLSVLGQDEIQLTHRQNSFSFSFSFLEYQNPLDTRYEYQLAGFDNRWRSANIERQATYIRVPPGNYTLHVRADNGTGEWNAKTFMRILISPAWWATWWAYSVYITLLLSIIHSIYSYVYKRKLEKIEYQRIIKYNKFRTRFYNNITHEFRTPLTVISGMTDALLKNGLKDPRKKLLLLRKNSEYLLIMVDKLLDITKMQEGDMSSQISKNDIIAHIRCLIESYDSLAREKSIGLHFYSKEQELYMDYDEVKIKIILDNLITNAIKFTPTYGKVNIYLNLLENQINSCLELIIEDTGIGISSEHLPNIFTRFYQVDSTYHEHSSGIGLSFVLELIKSMNGKIQVKSKLTKGSTFTIQFPISNNAPMANRRVGSISTSIGAGLSIGHMVNHLDTDDSDDVSQPILLIIEDNPDVIYYLKTLLETEYHIITASDGQRGIETAIDMLPNIIISDVMIPEIGGYDICHQLKNDQRTCHIPIILLTAKSTTEDKLMGLAHGADAYIIKPFTTDELKIQIVNLLEVRHTLQIKYSASLISSQLSSNRDLNPDEIFLKNVESIILANLDNENFSTDELARQLHLSRSQVYRKIKALTDMSNAVYVRHVRLQKAQELLRNTNMNISEIAYAVGFKTPVYFSQVFKDHFGVCPSATRNSLNYSVL